MSTTAELLSRLFKWRKHIQYEGLDFYLRIVGDQVVEDARQIALVESRKTRRALRDPNSNEYLIHLDPMKDFDDDELRAAIVILAARDVIRDYSAITPKRVVEPLKSNPTLEEQEQHQQAIEDRDKEYIEDMERYTEDWRSNFMIGLDKVSREVLERQYSRYRTDRVCETVFNMIFEDYLVAASIYKDADYNERAFTYEEFKGLPNEVKLVFKDAYTSMSLDPEDLKNSQSPAASP